MNNILVRNTMKEHVIKQWQVAELMGIREEKLSRMLRHELPIDEQRNIVALIVCKFRE